MRVALISPYSDISSLGVRSLSSCLKAAGHETVLIFLPHLEEAYFRKSMSLKYTEQVLDQVVRVCDGVGLIGISLMTNYFEKGVQLTCSLKARIQASVVWGGVHPTVRPEESLIYTDMVCIGEAEGTLVELVDKLEAGEDITNLRGLWVKRNGEIIRNEPRPLNEDLDSLPFFDYDLENHYVLRGTSLEPMTPQLLAEFFSLTLLPGMKGIPCYQTLTSRGCPFKCSYCCNHVYQSLYKGQRYVRRRSSKNIIEEVKAIRKRFDFLGAVQFSDDTIFAATESTIEEFSRRYKEEVNLPFYCLGHPATITEKKMGDLVDAGLVGIQIGIESASEATKGLYMRPFPNEKVLSTVRTVHKFRDKIFPPIYDFIVDNPYETDEELLETLHFILRFPRPYDLNIFSLVLFPGTELHKQATEDGYVEDEASQIYRKGWIDRQQNYLNLLFSLFKQGRIPTLVLRFLSHKRVVKVFNGKLRWVVKVIYDLAAIVRKRRAKFIDAAK